MPSDVFTIAIDTREQRPWTFDGWPTEPATLPTGDYSIRGLEERIAIERKSLDDFTGCCASGRERFKAELLRLKAYDCRAVVIEASLADIVTQRYRSRIDPAAVLGSVASWTARYGIPFILAGDRENAQRFALAMMRNYRAQLAEIVATLAAEPMLAAN